MSDDRQLEVVVFDVVETLFRLDAVDAALAERGAPDTTRLFFARLLRDAFALGSLGEYRPFAEIAESALRIVVPGLDDAGRSEVLAAFSRLDPHDDVLPAFELLSDAGLRLAVLTNGGAANTQALLDRAELSRFVEQVVSVEEVRVWKPRAEPYLHALARMGADPAGAAMVAVHAWDIHGAARVGMTTGWAARLEGEPAPVFTAPDVRGDDLVEVAQGLLSLG